MHDALFKAAFSQPDIARSELALLLPREVLAHLDLATLALAPGSFVDDELRHAHTDLLYTVRTTDDREALVFLLFEHQSSFDAQMPFRLLQYIVRVWDRWLLDQDTPAAKLPIVLPVLLHHGPAGWKAAPDFASMFDASPLLEAARPFQPHFRFLLDDLATLSLDALASRALGALTRLVELVFWSSHSFQRLEAAAPLMEAILSSLGHDERTRALLVQLNVYLLRAAPQGVDVESVRTILVRVAGARGQEELMNAGEQLMQQGHARGLRAAIEVVLSARGLKLSEPGRAKLATCQDVPRLTRWHARAVTAPSEAEIFADTDDDS